jgi:predicted DsbA family dithiol-disulfide isomerase
VQQYFAAMRRSGWLLLTQLSICVALAASAALYVHYLSPFDSGFCGPSSGCEAARRSGLGYFFGSPYISLPLFSLLAFGVLLGLSLRAPAQDAAQPSDGLVALWRQPSVTLFAASGVGALLGLGFIAYQALVLQQFCWLCLIVDSAAVACGVFAFMAARAVRKTGTPALSPLRDAAWLVIAALLVAGPLVWGAIKPPPPIPPKVAALYQPGKINVVEFADFECPYCRRLHGVLKPLLDEYGDAVFFVRAHRPLQRHPHAEHAARAAVCAAAQGKGDEMANQLFEVTLSDAAISRIAEHLRLDPLAFDRCLTSPATTAALEHDAALLPDDELQGLPTTFVGNQQFVGVPTEAALRDALDRARSAPPLAPSGGVFAAVLAAAIGLTGYWGRRRGH